MWDPRALRDERLRGSHLSRVVASDEPNQHVRINRAHGVP